jgi:hypothetical protein
MSTKNRRIKQSPNNENAFAQLGHLLGDEPFCSSAALSLADKPPKFRKVNDSVIFLMENKIKKIFSLLLIIEFCA